MVGDNNLEKRVFPTDKEVEKMLNEWDLVVCKICGEKISMLNAVSKQEGSYFICKKHQE